MYKNSFTFSRLSVEFAKPTVLLCHVFGKVTRVHLLQTDPKHPFAFLKLHMGLLLLCSTIRNTNENTEHSGGDPKRIPFLCEVRTEPEALEDKLMSKQQKSELLNRNV